MKKTMKQGGLIVLSTLALGTAVVPLFGENTVSAKAATSSTESAVEKDIVLKMQKLEKNKIPTNVFNYAKSGILSQISTLPLAKQVTYKRELQRLEANVIMTELMKKYDTLSADSRILRNIDVKLFEEQASRIAVNEKGYQAVQEQTKRLKEKKALKDFDGLWQQAKYGFLSPADMKELEKAASQFPEREVPLRQNNVKQLKEEQTVRVISNALLLAEKVPDKAFIAKVKAEVKALPSSMGKTSLLKKVSDLEKKQRVFTEKEFQERIGVAVGDVRFGQLMVPTYVKDVVVKELARLKSTNINKYLSIVSSFYGREVESYYRFMDNKQYITKDDLIVAESKLSAFKKSTGINDNNPYERNLIEYQKDEFITMTVRIQRLELYLPEGEVEDSLRRASLLNASAYSSLLRDVDRLRSRDAGEFIEYYANVGRYTSTKQADYDMAVKKINMVSDASLRQMMLQKLNRYQ